MVTKRQSTAGRGVRTTANTGGARRPAAPTTRVLAFALALAAGGTWASGAPAVGFAPDDGTRLLSHDGWHRLPRLVGVDASARALATDERVQDVSAPPEPAAAPAEPAGLVARWRDTVTAWGPLGAAGYVVLYAALTVFFVPAWPLTVGAGATYGVVWGTVLVSIGSVTGAGLAFLLARTLLRARVARWVAGNPRFAAIDRAVGREGWKIVALTRLSPLFPFNLQNYAYGLTAVGFWRYLLTSWVAMLPGTVLYVYIGAAGAEAVDAATGSAGWGRTLLQIVGVTATLLVTALITRIARRAVRDAAADIEGAGPAADGA